MSCFTASILIARGSCLRNKATQTWSLMVKTQARLLCSSFSCYEWPKSWLKSTRTTTQKSLLRMRIPNLLSNKVSRAISPIRSTIFLNIMKNTLLHSFFFMIHGITMSPSCDCSPCASSTFSQTRTRRSLLQEQSKLAEEQKSVLNLHCLWF